MDKHTVEKMQDRRAANGISKKVNERDRRAGGTRKDSEKTIQRYEEQSPAA